MGPQDFKRRVKTSSRSDPSLYPFHGVRNKSRLINMDKWTIKVVLFNLSITSICLPDLSWRWVRTTGDTGGLIPVSSEEAFCLSSHLQSLHLNYSPVHIKGVFPRNVTEGLLCFPVDNVWASCPGSGSWLEKWRLLQHNFYGVSALFDTFQKAIKILFRNWIQAKIQSPLKMAKRLFLF